MSSRPRPHLLGQKIALAVTLLARLLSAVWFAIFCAIQMPERKTSDTAFNRDFRVDGYSAKSSLGRTNGWWGALSAS